MLYVALILLILLALIGVVGLQVTGLQEKMAANFRAVNIAFQNTERLMRISECGIEDLVKRTTTAGCSAVVSLESCKAGFDAAKWVQGYASSSDNHVSIRSIGTCISGNASLAVGRLVNEEPNPVYQVTVFSNDKKDPSDTSDATAHAAIDSIFRP